MPGKASAAPNLSADELAKALDVKPPADPQALEDHVHQLLSRAQVSWLSKRDVLDILTNWQVYNLPISLMPPDQPGRALPTLTPVAARFERAPRALRRVVRVGRVRAPCAHAASPGTPMHATSAVEQHRALPSATTAFRAAGSSHFYGGAGSLYHRRPRHSTAQPPRAHRCRVPGKREIVRAARA